MVLNSMQAKDSVNWLIEIPKKNEKNVFLIDSISNTEITFGHLHNSASLIGNALKKFGFKKSDRIAIIMHDSLSLVKIYFGCLYSGIVIIPINPILTDNEIEHIIFHSDAKAVIVSHKTITRINPQKLKEKKISIVNVIENEDVTTIDNNFISLKINDLKEDLNYIPFQDVTSNDEMIVIYTSGTTSEPKAVVHRISDLVENARLFGKTVGIGPKNRFYNLLSLSYLGGYYNLLVLPYVLESSVVLSQAFDPKMSINFWDAIIKNNVNTLWLVPSIISILMETDRGSDGREYCKNNINLVLVGTAPLPVQLRKDFEKKYNVQIFENYGLSETLFISSNSSKHLINDGSVGQLLDGVLVRIVDKHGDDVKEGNEGEIFVKTPFLMKGYYDTRTHNSELILHNNWFETGDIGIIENSTLRITGRKKDLIIRGGINISPISIENVIYKHRDVLECAIVGVPHKFQGEEIIAIIRTKKQNQFEKIKEEIFDLCKKELSKIKIPSQIVQLREFPHSTYGKIQKNKIRAWLLLKQKEVTNSSQIAIIEDISDKRYQV
jgi:long-chain acyl-CoA synthetase